MSRFSGNFKASERYAHYHRCPDDYYRTTRDLTLEERGAYRDILAFMQIGNGPLKDDDALNAQRLHISKRKWQVVKRGLINKGKLFIQGGELQSRRANFEAEGLGR